MKYTIASAALIAVSIGTVCADTFIKGNHYGSAIDSITYANWGSPGTYQKVTDMSAGNCVKTPIHYGGGMAPLDGEVGSVDLATSFTTTSDD